MTPALPPGSPLTIADESIHPIGPEKSWREAYTFDFHDAATGITGVCYFGVHPHEELGDMLYVLWKDGVMVDYILKTDCRIPSDIGEDRAYFSRAAWHVVEPFKKTDCYVNNNGKSVVELRFEAINPPYDWRESSGAIAHSNSHHFEHQGRYTGTVSIEGETYEIKDAVGMRDRAWGWGNRAQIQAWLWVSACFGDDLAFNTFQVHMGDGSEALYGYVYRGGESNTLIRRARTNPTFHPLGGQPLGLDVEVEDVNGEILALTGKSITLNNESAFERNKWGHHFWCYTEFEHEGRKGYGMANYHFRGISKRRGDWTVEADQRVLAGA